MISFYLMCQGQYSITLASPTLTTNNNLQSLETGLCVCSVIVVLVHIPIHVLTQYVMTCICMSRAQHKLYKPMQAMNAL